MKIARLILPTVIAATGIASAGVGLASADTTASSSASSQTTMHHKFEKGTRVTDESTLASVKSAIEAKSAGSSVERVFKLSDGSYRVFTKDSAGKHIVYRLDSNFVVTKSHEMHRHHHKIDNKSGAKSTSSN